MINAQILLDSLNPAGNRLTTWILTLPRIILAELNTHRALSRNTSSSRAIPVSKLIEAVKTNPFIPTFWGKNQPGMQADEELDDTDINEVNIYEPLTDTSGIHHSTFVSTRGIAKREWLRARNNAVKSAEKLVELGLHKNLCNRLLEPFLHVTSLVSGTEWENFFALRAHKDAQPEFRALAYLMLDLYQKSEPRRLKEYDWHIPFGDQFDANRIQLLVDKRNRENPSDFIYDFSEDLKRKISVARCARVSYLNFEGKDDYEADVALSDRLSISGHWSAFEHCAEAMGESRQCGNFMGWKQYRKFFPNENRTDGRVQRFRAI